MIRKLNHRFLCSLFHLLAYLSDRTNGAALFVRPKLVIGGVIVGLGLALPEKAVAQKPSTENRNSPKQAITKDSSTVKKEVFEPFCYIVEIMPEFPGGSDMMFEFFKKNLRYPNKLVKKKIEGTVICSFVIGRDGSISEVKVVRGVHPLLNEEAVRLIKLFPKWTPARQLDSIVPVKYTLPVRFKLPTK